MRDQLLLVRFQLDNDSFDGEDFAYVPAHSELKSIFVKHTCKIFDDFVKNYQEKIDPLDICKALVVEKSKEIIQNSMDTLEMDLTNSLKINKKLLEIPKDLIDTKIKWFLRSTKYLSIFILTLYNYNKALVIIGVWSLN